MFYWFRLGNIKKLEADLTNNRTKQQYVSNSGIIKHETKGHNFKCIK